MLMMMIKPTKMGIAMELLVIGNGHQSGADIAAPCQNTPPKRLARKFARIPQNCGPGAAAGLAGFLELAILTKDSDAGGGLCINTIPAPAIIT